MRAWLVPLPAVVLLVAACGSAGAGASDNPFPASVYPKPASFPNWGSPNGCASLKHVAAIDRQQARRQSLRVLSQWGQISRSRDLHLSDRAEWPIVKENWKHKSGAGQALDIRSNDVVQGRGKRSPYAGLIRHNCGSRIVRRSWWVALCPGPYPGKGHCTLDTAPARTEHFMLLNRRDHWLVWFTYP
jgi:hypothetical protein